MSNFVRVAFISLIAAGFVPAHASDVVTLKGLQGYNFSKQSVTKNDKAAADLSIVALPDHKAALDARKIKSLGQGLPDANEFKAIKSWPNSVQDPTPGYYAVQGQDGKSIYLVELNAFAGSGKPSSWEMSFTFERLE